MKIKLLSLLSLALMTPSSGERCIAQCKQKGVVLEYNGRQGKKPFSQPVQLQFNTVAQINDENGQFILEFLKEKPGDLVSNYKIEPSDSKYTLFNEEVIKNWTLTPHKELKVELCKKERIEYYEKTYTRYEMARIKRERDEAIRKEKETSDLIENLKKIDKDYENQIKDLKAKIIDFAYKDETTLDSLQLLWRDHILANDYDAAEKVLQQMNLQESTAKRVESIEKSSDISFAEAQKLDQECDFLQKRIQSYRKASKTWQVIQKDYISLIKSYKALLDTYQHRLRCSDEYLSSLRDKAGNAMFDYADTLAWINYDSCMYWINEAARLDNVPACYELGNRIKDYKESLSWYNKAFDVANSNGKSVWRGRFHQAFTIDDIITGIESYPDFYTVHEGDTLYFHLLDSKRVSLVYLRHSSNMSIVNIPQNVKFNGRRYVVTKIGSGAINNISHGGLQKTESPWGTFPYSHKDARDNIKIVYLPNTIDTICINSIHNMGNVPKNLKHLGSWNGFSKELRIVRLPSNLIFLGNLLLNKDQTLVIPSSLQDIGETTTSGKVIVDDSNTHFISINGALYSVDKSKVWVGTVDSLLYIPRELKVDERWWYGVGYVAENIKEYKLDTENPYYSEYDDALYARNCDTLLFLTKKHSPILKLHPNTRVIANSYHLSNTYGINNIVVQSIDNIDAIYNLLNSYKQSYSSYKDMTLRLWGDSVILSSKEFDKTIDQAVRLHEERKGNVSYQYLCGLLHVINCDIEEAQKCYNEMPQQSELAKKLLNHLVKSEEKRNDAISYGLQTYHELQKDWISISDKERKVKREAIKNCLGPAIPFLKKELVCHPNNIGIHNIIGLYYSLHDNYPYIKQKAQESINRIKELDPEYATKGYELFEDLELSR